MRIHPNFTIHLRFFCLLGVYFFVVSSRAQGPEWVRATVATPGQSGMTLPARVAVHPDGSVFVIGKYDGDNSFDGTILTAPDKSFSDVFLCKYTADGKILWVKQLFRSEQWLGNHVNDLKIDKRGDLIFAGSCLTKSTVLGSDTASTGFFIAKCNADGNLRWIDFLPPTGGSHRDSFSYGNRIWIDSNDHILWLADDSNEVLLTGGMVVIKYSTDGNKLSNMRVSHCKSYYRPYIRDFSVDHNGNFIVSGGYPVVLSLVGGPQLDNDRGSNVNASQFFIASFSAKGVFNWVLRSSYNVNYLSAHTVDDAGNIYACLSLQSGSTIISDTDTTEVSANRYITKFTASGKLLWMKAITGSSIRDLYWSPQGFLCITGTYERALFSYESYRRAENTTNAFVLRIDTAGNPLGLNSAQAFNETLSDQSSSSSGYQSVTDNAGNFYTIGELFGKMRWGCDSLNLPPTRSYFLVKQPLTNVLMDEISGPGVVCEGTEVTLSHKTIFPMDSYQWHLPIGTKVLADNAVGSLVLVANVDQNRKPVLLAVDESCALRFSKPYVLHVLPFPKTPALVESESLVCPGASVKICIDTIENINYQWTLPEGMFATKHDQSGGSFTFTSEFKGGEVHVAAHNSCGTVALEFNIGVHPTPAQPKLQGNDVICPGVTTLLKTIEPVSNAVSYEWQLPEYMSFDPNTLTDGTTLNASVSTPFQAGEITVRAIGICEAGPSSSPISIRRSPIIGNASKVEGPAIVCTTGGPVTYTTAAIDNVKIYWWTIPGVFEKSGKIATMSPSIKLNPKEKGSGDIQVQGEDNCRSLGQSSSFGVRSESPLMTPLLMLGDCDLTIVATSDETSNWFYNGAPAPHLHGKQIVVQDSGDYQVQAENFCGVSTSLKVRAYPVISSAVLVGNVMTPNGDNKNDVLVIDKSLLEPSVQITNRWGASVYSSSNYKNDWHAHDVATGTYFVTVKHRCLPNGYRGWLSILR